MKLEKIYLKNHNRTEEDDNFNLFPVIWQRSTNYKLKIDILKEANSKKIDIINTDLYKKTLGNDII